MSYRPTQPAASPEFANELIEIRPSNLCKHCTLELLNAGARAGVVQVYPSDRLDYLQLQLTDTKRQRGCERYQDAGV